LAKGKKERKNGEEKINEKNNNEGCRQNVN
jgi:hypothetical protein